MSTASSAPCVVCNKPATSRCSQCSSAGVDLFFCSTEHQRAAWSVHKQVCGHKSQGCNPFIHPPLTEAEANEAKETLYKVGMPMGELLGGMGPVKLWDGLKSAGVREEQVNSVLNGLTLPRHQWRVLPNVFVSCQQLIRTVRYYRVQNSTLTPFFDPFSLLADFETGFGQSASMEKKLVTMTEPWYGPLCHRVVCFFAALQKKHNEMGNGPAFERYRDVALTEWQAGLKAFMRKEDARLVKFVGYATDSSMDAIKGTLPGF